MSQTITDDLDDLLDVLPPGICGTLRIHPERDQLLEIILDLGRRPEARFPTHEMTLHSDEVTSEDLDYVVERIGAFGEDNRAGIERTLHRISCLRNRAGRVVGLTCRVGRAVFGMINIVEDLVRSGKSLLLLGRPGVGKTTMLREVARVLAEDMRRRVIVVDTSNEIAGDGDIPHPAIGRARRMQVSSPSRQHAVMIEAVENHMPEVIIIDEIGTELEAGASRTIAERGVQLVGTAHGITLENLIMNPTLSDLLGGIQTVTLGDEEARRRGTQKSILERKAPPTFDIVVEIQDFHRVAVHADVTSTVDAILRGRNVEAEIRELSPEGEIVTIREAVGPALAAEPPRKLPLRNNDGKITQIFPFGISRSRLEQAAKNAELPVAISDRLEGSDAVLTARNYFRRRPQTLRDAETMGVPVYVLKNHTAAQIEQLLISIAETASGGNEVLRAIKEAEDASYQVLSNGQAEVELTPQNAYVRRLQHQVAQRYNLNSRSTGREPVRRVLISGGKPTGADE
ncbi:MAG: AAA family ATPase [Dehalococcoidia bacterium]|nr:AAA family ATPase [Dehalococcoidia bacterium]